MEKLHSDIIENILFRLPIDPALQARRVCKTWRNLLGNRRYKGLLFEFRLGNKKNKEVQLYYGEEYDHIDVGKINYYYSNEELSKLKHASLGRDVYRDGTRILVESCNGLVYFKFGQTFKICNPLTGEVVVLPSTRLKASGFLEGYAYGFGYSPTTNKYKFVKIYSMLKIGSMQKVAHVQVCTIGNGWRSIVSVFKPNNLHGSGIFVNGALHWLDYDEYKIHAFDVDDEKFRFLPKPPSEVQYRGYGNLLMLLGANLCLVRTKDHNSRINIWAYKKNSTADYDIKGHAKKSDYYNNNLWNWFKEFSIKVDEYYWEPFAITRSNQVLLWCRHSILYCYDPTTSTLNKLWDDNGMECSGAVAIPHTNSLISLKDLVENASEDYEYLRTL